MSSPWPRLRPVGDAALTVELGDHIDAEINARVQALDRALARDPFPGCREAVPSYRSLLVVYDPVVTPFEEACRRVTQLASAPPVPREGRRHVIPVRYGGEDGPDLPSVAAACGLSPSQVVALHTSHDYTAFMLGFLPGFAYLGLLPEALHTPRRATPRVRVPAGSVGITGPQTGVYPSLSPGGWNLLGRTSWRPFEAHGHPPARIAPGDRVRFEAVDVLSEEPPPSTPAALGTAVVEVLDPGALTLVQDAGRPGWRRCGVSAGGALDLPALVAANACVGNPAHAAGLECTLTGPTLRFLATRRFALAGADLGAVLHRADLGAWPVPSGMPVLGRAGNVLAFTARRSGCRAYLALAGGVDVPLLLGARATDLSGRFGGLHGRPLQAGDRLGLGDPAPGRVEHGDVPAALPVSPLSVRVVLGPQEDHFTPAARRALLESEYEISATSDRVGCRLRGRRLEHAAGAEIVSDGMVPGCIQVPPDGQPIIMLGGGPTTGGYPKIATVITRDVPLLGQMVPGEGRVRFEVLTVTEAQGLWRSART